MAKWKPGFDVFLGEDGLEESFQDEHPKTTDCHHCPYIADIVFVAAERGGRGRDKSSPKWENYIMDLQPKEPLRDNKGDPIDGIWPHDCVTVAVYFCRKCGEMTAKWDQA